MSRTHHVHEEWKVCASLFILFFSISVICCATVEINSDRNPPDWRYQEGSTYAKWEFVDNTTTTPPWDEGYNDFGETSIEVLPIPGHDWILKLGNATGVWPLCGKIYVEIDNCPQSTAETVIQIQLVWKPKYGSAIPAVSITDAQNWKMSNIAPIFEEPMPSDSQWTYSLYTVTWPNNPVHETILIANSIYVDGLVIDTYCMPEPSTYGIIGIGAFLSYRMRRR